MSDAPKFSVIMACYNAAPYVRQAIASVVGQTFSDWELIIVDDASQDDSLFYIQKASLSDPRIGFITNDVNKGAAAARNAAIEIAKGEWLAILDADDVYLPHKLEKQFEIIQKSNSTLVLIGGGCFHIDSEGVRSKEYNYPSSTTVLKKDLQRMRKFPPHSSLVYRKSSVLEVGGFNVLFARSQDYELWLKLSERGDFTTCLLPLIEYRLHSTNISNKECVQALSQVEYGVAARVCHMIRNTGLADPSEVGNAYLWNEFLAFVATAVRQSGYYEYVVWKNNFKRDMWRSINLFNKLHIILLYFYQFPSGIVHLMREHIIGNRLPGYIFKSWITIKGDKGSC